ncbi:MAG TPA: NAD-binding protein [Gallionella sp.]|nr:NAD-binding protein [Gallionella sp.]
MPFTALEVNHQQVDFVRRFGSKIYFGDATRLDLLLSAKTGNARLFVLAIDDVEASLKTAALVRQHFPGLPILARARNRTHYFRLRDLGITMIYRETFLTSIAVAQQALLNLGFTAAAAERAVTLFRQHDEELIEQQHAVHHDEAQLIQNARLATEQLKSLFEADTVDLLQQVSGTDDTGPEKQAVRS